MPLARFMERVDALVGVKLRLKDEEREILAVCREAGVGELNDCPVGAISSR